MKEIAFLDTEIDPNSKKLLDIGAIDIGGNVLHTRDISLLKQYLSNHNFLCGHNIIHHDLVYLKQYDFGLLEHFQIIDTLYWSPLLFPSKPYHNLIKDDKLQTEELNNPVNDSIKARDLFYDELRVFNSLPIELQYIYFQLLGGQIEFKGFFEYLDFNSNLTQSIDQTISAFFKDKICTNIDLPAIIDKTPIELAYCLAIINTTDYYSITPPWVLKQFPEVQRLMYRLRNKPCLTGCNYCDIALDAKKGLKDFFGYDDYRKFGGEPLQENAVNAAIENKSLLAIFPTGGGKSLTFQIPALMAGRNERGLSIVISPLQSLMKDQVDNLEKNGITSAVTINGLLDPIERSKAIQRVADGSASILYISPESLRSRTIERLLLGRNIVRFIIDEAHCFSSWGQDFRVDYLYIGDFINNIQNKKNSLEPIQVSCFTATAKQNVVDDICLYFEQRLGLRLEVYRANASRTNLNYKIFDSKDEEDKYNNIRRLLSANDCPTIIYTSRTRKASVLAEHLRSDGYDAKAYHGKMDRAEKTKNQNDFIDGKIRIMVATSAFGMGVDKKDVGMVIHYDISDSLENYVQESGRAGRDEDISADCYVLYSEDDLSKHFILLNQTKLSVKEIQQIWKAIKSITKYRSTVSNSALEIARKAGWDDSVRDIETRVKTAISALEQAGYLKRGQNIPQIFANSIMTKNAQEAITKIHASGLFNDRQKTNAVRIIKKLFSTKSRKHQNEEIAESRIDYISDHLGIVKADVIKTINLLREAKILADNKDLNAFIKRDKKINTSLLTVTTYGKLEQFLLSTLTEKETVYNIKELNEEAQKYGCSKTSPKKIKNILNFWVIKHWIKRKRQPYSNHHLSIMSNYPIVDLKTKLKKRHELARYIVSYLHEKTKDNKEEEINEEILVEFSVMELKEQYQRQESLFKVNVSTDDIEDSLFYLTRIEAMKIEGGFLVLYNKLTIDRKEQNNQIQYKKEDYKQLEQFYNNKIQQIHIVGEYAKKMLDDYQEALGFVEDYFKLNYSSFLKKYFPGSRREEIQLNISPKKFKQLFGTLSPRQLQIIKDNKTQNIVVAAGPGSGKTRVLVHKLASLLLMEEVKHEQLLMLTFSRAATTEFKKRLLELIGNAANFIDIKTFHSYCFDLLGKVGDLEKSKNILQETVERIRKGDVEINKITKSVLVIDEAQDMDQYEFDLVKEIMIQNENLRIIAVGDDDQNIYTFRGADSKYFEQFVHAKDAKQYELIENYRSKKNLVDFSNQFVKTIKTRFKTTPIVAIQHEEGMINLVQYTSKQMIVPLVNQILKTELIGTTAVLTKTNEEALQITGLLLKNNFPAKLVQSNDIFNLFDLVELRSFYNEISDGDNPRISKEIWTNAKNNYYNKYKNSSSFELCKALIKDFQIINPKAKYKSDFELFIRESRLEDFAYHRGETISVSTIHKAKGKEFDNVFLLLNDINIEKDSTKRQLYVAMTRAKNCLYIHYNNAIFRDLDLRSVTTSKDTATYNKPQQLIYHLSHRDVQLSYFEYVQHRINKLVGGSVLSISKEGLTNTKGELIVRFSRKYKEEIASMTKSGYKIITAKVNYILYWNYNDEKTDQTKEIKIVLPALEYG